MNPLSYILKAIQILWSLILSQIDSRGIWANFLGGLFLVLVVFIWNDLLRRNKNLSGEWEVANSLESSDLNSFLNLKVLWRMHILQNGTTISGSGEKIKEISSDGQELEYDPEKRDSVELQGYIEKSYLPFRKNHVFINVIQVGRLRRSRATYTLKYKTDSELIGRFITTAGNSRGKSVFLKNV